MGRPDFITGNIHEFSLVYYPHTFTSVLLYTITALLSFIIRHVFEAECSFGICILKKYLLKNEDETI